MGEKIKTFFVDLFLNKGVQLLWGICAVILGLIAIKIAMRIIKRIFSKSKLEKITQSFLLSIIKFVLYVILILIIAQMFGIPVTGMIALLSTAGLAVGLALQDSLSNLANGIIIISTKPFREGDYVQIGSVEGSVKNIKMLTTAIVTTDNKLIVLPNSKIVTSEVINYNILGKRRISFNFSVAYESDVKKVRDIIFNIINSDGRVYQDPKPFVSLNKLNDSNINFFANCWCDSGDYWDIYYYVLNNVFNEFKKEGISIPYNQMEIRLRDDKVPCILEENILNKERVEKVRVENEPDFIEQLSVKNLINNIKEQAEKKKKEKKKNKKNKKNDVVETTEDINNTHNFDKHMEESNNQSIEGGNKSNNKENIAASKIVIDNILKK